MHFHPLRSGVYVMVFAHRWTAATPAPGNAALYTSHQEDPTPGWAQIHTTGVLSPIGGGYPVPGADGYTLVGACSKGTYLYILSANGDTALLQHFRWNPGRETMSVAASEIILPATVDGQQITFTRGLYWSGPYLMVIGSGATDNQLYLARKPWGKVGAWTTTDKGGWGSMVETDNAAWHYRGTGGWSTEVTESAPLPITTRGPVSVAVSGNRTSLGTVEAAGATRTGRVWTRRDDASPFTQLDLGVDLGQAGTTYLGGTVQLQDQLRGDTIPYVTTVLQSSGGNAGLDVRWGSV